jgi:hypothetical protein
LRRHEPAPGLQTFTTLYTSAGEIRHAACRTRTNPIDEREQEVIVKSLIATVLAMVSLAGCVAVPYYDAPPPRGYYYYGPPVPPASFHFRYDYRRHR